MLFVCVRILFVYQLQIRVLDIKYVRILIHIRVFGVNALVPDKEVTNQYTFIYERIQAIQAHTCNTKYTWSRVLTIGIRQGTQYEQYEQYMRIHIHTSHTYIQNILIIRAYTMYTKNTYYTFNTCVYIHIQTIPIIRTIQDIHIIHTYTYYTKILFNTYNTCVYKHIQAIQSIQSIQVIHTYT